MFNFLVSAALRNRLLVLAVAAAVVVWGGLSALRLPVDVFPDLNKPAVTIMTEAEGLAPEEVEQLLTVPIETTMNGLPGVTRVRSVSGVGLGIVYVEFDWGTDIYRNRQQVTERLGAIQSQLPPRVVPQMAPVSSIMGEILLLAVSSETASAMELRDAADWILRPRLLTIAGVSQVIPIGGEVRQIRITLNLAQMAALDITREQVELTLRQFGSNTAGGFVDQHAREYLIRNIGRTAKLEDLKSQVVLKRQGVSIRLGQIADIDFAARVKRGDASFMGKSAVIVSVQKQPGADTVALTRDIQQALTDLQRAVPPGIKVTDTLFRQADFIEASIGNVQRVLVEAMIVVAIVLFLFLLEWRTTLISLIAIPVSVMTAALVFHLLGLTINTMTLGGLAIAIGRTC
jgi:heavy-metal exporter, HME family